MLVVTSRRPTATFTPRESRILDLLRAGHAQKEVAARLGISPWTVKRHLENARRRSGAASTTQVVVLFARTRGAAARAEHGRMADSGITEKGN